LIDPFLKRCFDPFRGRRTIRCLFPTLACQKVAAGHSLGAVLGLDEFDEDELYAALDFFRRSQVSVATS
jgi:hypothetical protein